MHTWLEKLASDGQRVFACRASGRAWSSRHGAAPAEALQGAPATWAAWGWAELAVLGAVGPWAGWNLAMMVPGN